MKMSTVWAGWDVRVDWLLPPQLPDTAARSRGQGGAPGWTNDLDRGEDRGSVGLWRAQATAERRAGPGDGGAAAPPHPPGLLGAAPCRAPGPAPLFRPA